MYQDITELFVFVDDFCKAVDQYRAENQIGNPPKPTRTTNMSISEIMTIVIMFQKSPCKNFKYFFKSYLLGYHKEFPNLCSYTIHSN